MHDAAIMHYVAFLMDHGWRPYIDIIDINMPGSYLTEWAVIHSFGGGSAAWRCFDVLTMFIAILSAVVIAGPQRRLAGVFAGTCLGIFHLANGPIEAGQRDWILMTLFMVAIACLAECLRKASPWFLFAFAALTGYACTIKPLAIPAPFLFLIFACWVLRRRGVALRPYLLAALGGAAAPTLLIAMFFLREGSFPDFLRIAGGLTRLYAGEHPAPILFLTRFAFGIQFDLLLLMATYIMLATRGWKQWENCIPVLGLLCGALLYIGQRKGFQYHKATMFAFAFLWISMQLYSALRQQGYLRGVGVAGAAALCCLMVWGWAPLVRHSGSGRPVVDALSTDLDHLGGQALSGNVQCMEMVDGCLATLYDMRLVQSTGFIFDSLFFTPTDNVAVTGLRRRFQSELEQKRPRVIVLMAEPDLAGVWTYGRIAGDPQLQQLLEHDYLQSKDTVPPGTVPRFGDYRLYLKR